MPKITFNIPASVLSPQPNKQNHDHLTSIGIAGAVGIMAIVALVLTFGQALDTQTAAVVANTCGPGLATSDPLYADQLDQLGYKCNNPGPLLWCCYKE